VRLHRCLLLGSNSCGQNADLRVGPVIPACVEAVDKQQKKEKKKKRKKKKEKRKNFYFANMT
jgi:hypothetical protein